MCRVYLGNDFAKEQKQKTDQHGHHQKFQPARGAEINTFLDAIVNQDDYCAYDYNGDKIYRIVANRYLDIDMHFTSSVHDFKEPLYTVEVKE